MDVLGGLLDGPRARGAFLLRMVMEPPWSVRVEDRAPLSLMCMTEGEAWLVPDRGEPVLMRPGDVAIARGPDPYTIADDPGSPPQALVAPGGICRTLNGEPLGQSLLHGVRTWGNDPEGSVVMQVGTYLMEGEVSGRLLDALPPLVHLRAGEWACPLLPVLEDEIAKDEPGQSVMLDRILDLVLVVALRSWFSRPESSAPAWYRAMGDPVTGPVLRLMQDEPARPWTVASLAAGAGVSRAALARRFHDLVGEPPMAYLTRWRLDLAADLLRETDATVESIARRVGYSGGFALSAAFKRVRGISPQEHRTRRGYEADALADTAGGAGAGAGALAVLPEPQEISH
ncbi:MULTISPECIES: AraC family transcriptional regulator [Streptomyces]|uniref:AraC family transcriptional regulator n=1 Tax=Streptomyces tsukubensis (strain DSM 42081 / NBRC 108919 / NRRL 18488 / 9993) TaxID=1114943 RepID=I2N9A9_STRT9|nr:MULTISPECIES: AraC family transcriptional regulator [Streptomyces]AZK97445.1 AraC family transcriptional regulator [Streptomyces tsukubensis]EIF93606.1 AraC family transcription regulator [Streptomyces tsukubensis NRRL18488]MYS63541.1 helix-turn-helix domain-containing protein [Streptomyces sp. SID5473]QKM66604.1 AraC family transcriptional regulator [Streptomyces tsukubensis NRRL18488]TAI45052.1 AraC family transcriptional regulator [Streptomyces tsukubensis]